MWTAKITIPFDKTAFLGNLAKKYRVILTGYPLSHFGHKDHIHLITAGYIQGEKEDIQKFIRDLKKDKRLIKIEVKGNFAVMEIEQHIANKVLFEPGIINVSPPLINKEGEYSFELASWDKNVLLRVIKIYSALKVKLNWIKQKKIDNIQIVNALPSLTEKQRKALQLAIDHGYYGYPRKIDLVKLAKLSGISYSTYEFHLRNAEKKVIPFLNIRIS